MCVQKPTTNGTRSITSKGKVYYPSTPQGIAAEIKDTNKAMGPGAGEGTRPEPPAQPPPDLSNCSTYTNAMWNNSCSKHFKYASMNRKPAAEVGRPPINEIACNWQKLCENILDKVKDQFPKVSISSGYRSSAFDKSCGGSGNGDHTWGKAADIQLSGGNLHATAKQLFKFIGASGLPFSQLIYEGTWVHVSYNGPSPGNLAVLVTRTGKASYQNGGGRAGAKLPPDLAWA